VSSLRGLCLAVLLFASSAAAPANADPLYPDLRALPPNQLSPRTVLIDGVEHHVLRFTAEIANVGPGPLELRGDSSTGRTLVFQRLHDDAGGVTETPVGTFVFHPAHEHWHFENFAAYELWARDEYDAWLASDRQVGRPRWQGAKTTGGQLEEESFCLRDSRPLSDRGTDQKLPRYLDCSAEAQGISVGWVDEYLYILPEQWIDLGAAPLQDGDYVLRVEVDPLNRLLESPDQADPSREAPSANEGVTIFHVEGGCPDDAVLAILSRFACRGELLGDDDDDELPEDDQT
jgi:hypothetical protein